MRRLNSLDFTTALPFVLEVSDRHNGGLINDQQFVAIVGVLENYLVRRHLVGEPASYLNGVFPALASRMDWADPVASLATALAAERYPSDASVLRALKVRRLYDTAVTTKRRTVLVLNTLNRHLSAGKGGYTVLDGDATIEHVMPQTLDDVWKSELGPLWDQVSRDLLHTLGNLTLVTSGWNSALSNAPFANKVPKLGSHALALNHQYFGTVQQWRREDILNRAEWLGSKILEVWPSLDPALVLSASSDADAPGGLSEFHFEAVERVALHIGVAVLRISKARYASADRTHGLVGMCSKPYIAASSAERQFWFGLRVSQLEFLKGFAHRWVGFECETPDTLVLFPLEQLEPHLPHLHTTEDSHWHIWLHFEDGSVYLRRPLMADAVDITAHILQPALP